MRTWIITELYHPDKTSTPVLLTQLSQGLAITHSVGVITGPPKETKAEVPSYEEIGGVSVYRAFGTNLSQHNLVSRALNLITVSISIGWKALLKLRKGDCVIVVTNPPVLPYVIAIAARLRHARAILLVYDVYPEVLEVAGMLRPGSVVSRMLNWLATRMYRQMAAIIVLGRDMWRIVGRHLRPGDNSIVMIPNWTDATIEALPDPDPSLRKRLGLEGKFVVQYSGNMGRTHDLEILLEAAETLRGDPDIHFLFIGGGAQKDWLTLNVEMKQLRNVTVEDWFPRDELNAVLSVGDLGVISFKPGMCGVSVPSRMYNVLASGRPVLAISESDSELARVVTEHNVGFVVMPSDCDALVRTIRLAASDRGLIREMGVRARTLAETEYSFDRSLNRYRTLIEDVSR